MSRRVLECLDEAADALNESPGTPLRIQRSGLNPARLIDIHIKSDENVITNNDDFGMNQFPYNNASFMEDKFDAIGRNVAAKLRNMHINQKIVVKKLLSDILLAGQVGILHRDANIHA